MWGTVRLSSNQISQIRFRRMSRGCFKMFLHLYFGSSVFTVAGFRRWLCIYVIQQALKIGRFCCDMLFCISSSVSFSKPHHFSSIFSYNRRHCSGTSCWSFPLRRFFWIGHKSRQYTVDASPLLMSSHFCTAESLRCSACLYSYCSQLRYCFPPLWYFAFVLLGFCRILLCYVLTAVFDVWIEPKSAKVVL